MSAARQPAWFQWVSAWRCSLGFRIVAVILTVSLLLSVVAIVYDRGDQEQSAREHLLAHGRSVAKLAALALPDAVLSPDGYLLPDYTQSLVVDDPNIAFVIVRRWRGGKEVELEAFPEGASEAIDDSATLVVSEPILVERGGDRCGTFVCGITLRPMQQELRERTVVLLARSGLGFLVLAWLLWLALRHVVVQPVRRLDAEAQRLGRGDLSQPIANYGSTELGRLGRTLDEMRVSLHTSHEALAQQNRQLLELDQLKCQFLANMSHEIRTPLTSILGGVEILVDPGSAAQDRLESIAAMERNGEQLLELVDRLLDLAKLEAGNLLLEKRSVRCDQIVRSVCERYAAEATGQQVELHLDIAALAEQPLWTDPNRLRQVLKVVVGNAFKFTPSGRIDVQARIEGGPESPHLRLVVADTGVGIADAFLPRLFEPFSQADGSLTRRHGGTGLGMAMARRIVRQLGGDITVQSEVGRGTRVEIVLGIAAPTGAAANAATIPPQKPAVAPAKGRVLVVDDALDSQRLLKALLTRAGYLVELAGNGREAVDAVQKAASATQYDLVLMDLQMPELDGVSAIRVLRERGFHLPIVALTAHALAEDRQQCLEAGATGYETKPITRQRLLEVVAAHLAVKTPAS